MSKTSRLKQKNEPTPRLGVLYRYLEQLSLPVANQGSKIKRGDRTYLVQPDRLQEDGTVHHGGWWTRIQ